MRCIILAGGLGKRLRPLTNHTPKALLEAAGKPIIEHTLEALPDDIISVVIAVKHLGQKIKGRLGKKFGKKRITYVDLTSLRGTMDAVRQCKKYVKGPTMNLNGDDLYSRKDLLKLVERSKKEPKSWFVLVKEVDEMRRFGEILVDNKDNIQDIIEPGAIEKAMLPGLVNTGAYITDERIFRYRPVKNENGECGLPQTIMQAKGAIPIIAVEASFWMPCNTPEDYKHVQEILVKSFSRNSSKKVSE